MKCVNEIMLSERNHFNIYVVNDVELCMLTRGQNLLVFVNFCFRLRSHLQSYAAAAA